MPQQSDLTADTDDSQLRLDSNPRNTPSPVATTLADYETVGVGGVSDWNRMLLEKFGFSEDTMRVGFTQGDMQDYHHCFGCHDIVLMLRQGVTKFVFTNVNYRAERLDFILFDVEDKFLQKCYQSFKLEVKKQAAHSFEQVIGVLNSYILQFFRLTQQQKVDASHKRELYMDDGSVVSGHVLSELLTSGSQQGVCADKANFSLFLLGSWLNELGLDAALVMNHTAIEGLNHAFLSLQYGRQIITVDANWPAPYDFDCADDIQNAALAYKQGGYGAKVVEHIFERAGLRQDYQRILLHRPRLALTREMSAFDALQEILYRCKNGVPMFSQDRSAMMTSAEVFAAIHLALDQKDASLLPAVSSVNDTLDVKAVLTPFFANEADFSALLRVRFNCGQASSALKQHAHLPTNTQWQQARQDQGAQLWQAFHEGKVCLDVAVACVGIDKVLARELSKGFSASVDTLKLYIEYGADIYSVHSGWSIARVMLAHNQVDFLRDLMSTPVAAATPDSEPPLPVATQQEQTVNRLQTALNKEASLGNITLQEDAQGNIDIDIGDDIPDEWLDVFVKRYSLQSLTLHVGPFNLEGSGIKIVLKPEVKGDFVAGLQLKPEMNVSQTALLGDLKMQSGKEQCELHRVHPENPTIVVTPQGLTAKAWLQQMAVCHLGLKQGDKIPTHSFGIEDVAHFIVDGNDVKVTLRSNVEAFKQRLFDEKPVPQHVDSSPAQGVDMEQLTELMLAHQLGDQNHTRDCIVWQRNAGGSLCAKLPSDSLSALAFKENIFKHFGYPDKDGILTIQLNNGQSVLFDFKRDDTVEIMGVPRQALIQVCATSLLRKSRISKRNLLVDTMIKCGKTFTSLDEAKAFKAKLNTHNNDFFFVNIVSSRQVGYQLVFDIRDRSLENVRQSQCGHFASSRSMAGMSSDHRPFAVPVGA